MVGGTVNVYAANAGEIALSTTSGAIEGSVRTQKLEADSVSGSIDLTLDTLPADLTRILNKPEPTEERVYIRADRTVRYGDFMAVMNTLQGNGFFQVALINEEL